MNELMADEDAGSEQTKSRRWPRKRLLWMAALLAAAAGGGLYSNYYISQHQLLFIVSGLDSPVTVEIPGVLGIEIPAEGVRQVEVPEGAHRAEVTGATNQTISFSIHVPYARRWTDRHARILNVAGSAVVAEETTYYTTDPELAGSAQEGEQRWHYGDTYLEIPDIDYFFQDFPDQVKADTRQGRTARRRVDKAALEPKQLFYALVNGQQLEEALRLAEWHLRAHPQATDLLPTYLGAARLADREERARVFLAEGAERRPADIQWHRMYQETRHEDAAALAEEYDRLLAEEPGNSAWLYLRGRLAATCAEAADYYERAIAADAENAFAHFALGMVRCAQKRWAEAKELLGTAVALHSDDTQFRDALFDARMALREHEALVEDLTARLSENALHYHDNVRLADVYATLGRDEALRDLLMGFAREMHERFGQAGFEAVVNFNARVAYSIGNFDEIEELARTAGEEFPKYALFQALVEQARFEEAFRLFPLEEGRMQEPLHFLVVSVALSLAERADESRAWLNRALELFAANRPEYQEVGRLLGGAQAPEPAEVLQLVLPPAAKAQICAALGLKFPELKETMFGEVKTFNVSRDYPFHLLNRVADGLEEPEPATTPEAE